MHAIVSAQEASTIRAAIPLEVAVMELDPVVALLVTLYIVYIGQIVGEEMAATVGFPVFPADRTERLGLMRDLEYDLDAQWAVRLIEQLERSLHLASVSGETAEDDQAAEEDLLPEWTMRAAEKIYSVRKKHEVIRMAFCQTVHHRAQLGVFLRLLDVPIPGSYGPSADEQDF